jgi:hypothetical protein
MNSRSTTNARGDCNEPAIRFRNCACSGARLLGGWALSAEDKYTLQVPNGLKFSEFRGYENWQVINVARTEGLLKVIVGNPVVMDAYRAGIPGNGKPFPDGSKMAKVEWHPKKSATAPYDIAVADTIYDLDFMVKDAKRFADSGGGATRYSCMTPRPEVISPAL